MDKFRDKQFLSGMFLEESREQIENMEVKVIEIEFSPYNSENMDALMRIAHSIKGASKTMEYHVMSRLAHYFENIIASEMDEEARFAPDVIKRLLKILDIMKKNWQKISETKGMEELFIDFESIFDDDSNEEQEFEIEDDEIEAIAQVEEDRSFEAAQKAQEKEGAEEASEADEVKVEGVADEKVLTNDEIELSKMVSKYKSVYKLLIYFHEKSKTKSVKMFLVINNLVGIGDILRINPENYENLTDEKIGDYFSVILATNSPNEEIRENVNVISEIDKVDIVRIRKGLELEDKKNLDYSHIAHMSRREDMLSVRVNISKIDELLNLMGEFVIDREKLNTLSRHMKNKYKDIYEVKILSDVLKSINNISKEIQSKIISVRMLPLDYIFSRFHRFVRSTAEEYKKDIKFTISGEDIEVDRSIIEKLLDPLNHILRNAIDHGIETIEERVQKGKNKEGKISITAKAKGNNIVIEIEDDGRGIDLDKIKSKIVEEYSIEDDKLDGISENNIIKYIFNQGFSTSDNIDEISGRGIGLDIVNRAIGNLNGIIDIETEKDRGTKFIIKLPMTLAIMKALLVVEGGIKFAIPTSNILDVLILKEEDIKDKIYNLSGEEFFDWRDQESIPLVRFSEYFDIKQGRGADLLKKMHIVVIGYSERRVALAVEGLWREQEIVVKSLDDFRGEEKLLGTLDGISGISVLGDGSFSRVIDILSIVEG